MKYMVHTSALFSLHKKYDSSQIYTVGTMWLKAWKLMLSQQATQYICETISFK